MDPYSDEAARIAVLEEELREQKAHMRRRIRRAVWITVPVTLLLTAAVIVAVFGGKLRSAMRYRTIIEAANVIESKYIADYDSEDMTVHAVDGLLESVGDRWSYYVSKEELEGYTSNVMNSYVGIGVTVKKGEGEPLTIVTVNGEGGAADAGLVPGDRIAAVDGASVLELTLNESRALIAGESGTTVELIVLHEDGSEETIAVERRKIQNSPVSYELCDDIGYIKLKNFNKTSADGFKAAISDLLEQGAKGFVFDVRFNGGGQVTELTSMLDFLLPEGEIFRMVDKDGNAEVTQSDASSLEMPMAVLVNDSSYSAAEFFAACLAEYEAAVVVGTHTTGKGYAQTSYYLSDGSCLVLSSRAYFTPSGISLAGIGIEPDIELDLDGESRALLYADALEHEDDIQWLAAMDAVNSEIGG